jgi:hypothetical protein
MVVASAAPLDLEAVQRALATHASGVATTVAHAFGDEALEQVRSQLDAEAQRLSQSITTLLT